MRHIDVGGAICKTSVTAVPKKAALWGFLGVDRGFTARGSGTESETKSIMVSSTSKLPVDKTRLAEDGNTAQVMCLVWEISFPHEHVQTESVDQNCPTSGRDLRNPSESAPEALQTSPGQGWEDLLPTQ